MFATIPVTVTKTFHNEIASSVLRVSLNLFGNVLNLSICEFFFTRWTISHVYYNSRRRNNVGMSQRYADFNARTSIGILILNTKDQL